MSENKKSYKWSLLATLLITAILALAPFGVGIQSASAQPAPIPAPGTDPNPAENPEDPQPDETTNSDEDDVTCAIEKIGWILCPVIEQSARIGDQAFAFLAKTFLETEPELISNTQGAGTQMAWDMARNLANIMFIIAFLIIIYSQITGAGITNYGIKKMLPRLILAAIAVNVSYYICQIMVDLSNIMGYELQRFLVDSASRVTQNTAMPIASGDSFQSGGGVLSTIAVSVLAAGLIIYFLLPVLGAVIGLVLITCLSIIIILLLRKAFIVLLIVASPIAFVMYLLPNTEKYFQKWLSMFWKLLLVFPVIGLLMGGGQLASSVVLVAGVSSNTYDDGGNQCVSLPNRSGAPTANSGGECVAGAVPFLLGLTAAGIAVLPLIAVWSVLKGALSAAGAIGGKIGATVSSMNNGSKGRLSKARQELGEYRKNKRDVAAMTGNSSFGVLNSGARMRARRRGKYAAMKEDAGAAQESYTRAARLGDTGTPEDAARMLQNRKEAYRDKINSENIAVERMDVRRRDDPTNAAEAQELINNKQFDSPRLAALLEQLNESEHHLFMGLASQLNQRDKQGRPVHSLATDTAAKAMAGAGIYGGMHIAQMQQGGGIDLRSAAIDNAATGGLSAASITNASKTSLEGLSKAINSTAGSSYGRGATSDPVAVQKANDAAINAQRALAGMSKQLSDQVNDKKKSVINGM